MTPRDDGQEPGDRYASGCGIYLLVGLLIAAVIAGGGSIGPGR